VKLSGPRLTGGRIGRVQAELLDRVHDDVQIATGDDPIEPWLVINHDHHHRAQHLQSVASRYHRARKCRPHRSITVIHDQDAHTTQTARTGQAQSAQKIQQQLGLAASG